MLFSYNSLEIEEALEKKELVAVLTKDEHIIVIKNNIDGRVGLVDENTYNELKALDLKKTAGLDEINELGNIIMDIFSTFHDDFIEPSIQEIKKANIDDKIDNVFKNATDKSSDIINEIYKNVSKRTEIEELKLIKERAIKYGVDTKGFIKKINKKLSSLVEDK